MSRVVLLASAHLQCEGCERQAIVTLVPGHGRPLKADDCTNVSLMVFDCNGIFPMLRSIALNLVEGQYNAVVDGEYIEINELKTKFEPYNGSSRLSKRALVETPKQKTKHIVSPTLQLKCEQCGWISENEVCVNMAVQEHAPGSSRRNSRVNLSLKCEGCERQGTITLVPGYGRSLRVDDCTNVPRMVFDCNGIFPVYYSFNGGWPAVTESGSSINLNLVGGDYNAVVDGECIEIKELKTKFEPYNG